MTPPRQLDPPSVINTSTAFTPPHVDHFFSININTCQSSVTFQISPSKGNKILYEDNEMIKIIAKMEIDQQPSCNDDSGDEGKELGYDQAFETARMLKSIRICGV